MALLNRHPTKILLISLILLCVMIGWFFTINGWLHVPPAQATNIQPVSSEKIDSPAYPPELENVWFERDWPRVITSIQSMRQTQSDSALLKIWLAHAYLQQGISLRHQSHFTEAKDYFDKSLQLTPYQPTAQQEYEWADTYLKGLTHYEAGRWARAISMFATLWEAEPEYGNLRNLLYSAYYNEGLTNQAKQRNKTAHEAFEAAHHLRPDLNQPRLRLAELDFEAIEGTPVEVLPEYIPIKGKLIVVGIEEQQMWVYEDGKRVFDFIASTGEPGRETRAGDYEILNKIDVAYAGTWNLDMPYWMGIYWAGHLQNGIHALPTVRHTGYKLWEGYLGQRVSYGCVILSDEDAATLYYWADVGSPMKIVPSLAQWSPR